MLSREQALEWCVKHLVEWPEVKPSIAPDGWYWRNSIVSPDQLVLFTDYCRNGESLISKRTFLNNKIDMKTEVYDPDNDIKLKPFDSCKIVKINLYRNQFSPSSFSFKYLMKNVHKMARS